jgi:CO/xanthine dehydrogenase FAD-binding subunit
MSFSRPETLQEALEALASGARVLAGGTDLYTRPGSRLGGKVIDPARIPGMTALTSGPGGIRIGALASWSSIAEADMPPALDALSQAARQIGGRQVQNMGTIGGNLCNASPAADGVPPLLVLGAEVELASAKGARRMALSDFLIGPRKVALGPDELLVAIHLPKTSLVGRSAFEKLGARAHLVISIASVAVRLVVDQSRIVECQVAVGACSAVPRRLPDVERALLGPVQRAANRIDPAAVAAALDPIDDSRATAAYRRHAVAHLVRRAMEAAL